MHSEVDDRPESLLWAYLSDPMPTRGPERLHDQKLIVDTLATGTRRDIVRYVVASGGMLTAEGKCVSLLEAIDEALAAERNVTLLVASVACFGSTRDARRAMLADLLAAGLAIEDPSGSLHPTITTVALARAAASRRAARVTSDATSSNLRRPSRAVRIVAELGRYV